MWPYITVRLGFEYSALRHFFFLLTFNIWISFLYSKSFHIFNIYKVTSANLELSTSTSKLKLQVEIFNFLFKLEKIIEKASLQNNFSTFLRIFARFLEMLRMKIQINFRNVSINKAGLQDQLYFKSNQYFLIRISSLPLVMTTERSSFHHSVANSSNASGVIPEPYACSAR